MDDKIKICKIINANWMNVIIMPEFYSILELNTLKEVSLQSKLIRLKLKPILFENIKYDASKFDSYYNSKDNLLWEYFDRLRNKVPYVGKRNPNRTSLNELKLDNALLEFEKELSKFKPYATSFKLVNVKGAGYHLFPLLINFDHLISLSLKECAILSSSLSGLHNSMPKLEHINLFDVMLDGLLMMSRLI